MSKYLIIPDIHLHHLKAQRVIDTVPHDMVIFLGDFFHDFGDTPSANADTAIWLKKKLADPTCVCLWGNHDMVSWVKNDITFCSGWDPIKQEAINSVLGPDDWHAFKPFFHVPEGNWLISHAGVNRHIFADPDGKLTLDGIALACANGLSAVANGVKPCHPFGAGYDRGGYNRYGGITWQDFDCLVPLKEFKQIVGHTCRWKFPQVSWMSDSGRIKLGDYRYYQGWDSPWPMAVCLDTANRHYGILEHGKLSIHESKQFLT